MDATNNFNNAYRRMQKPCGLYECEALCRRFSADDQYSWSVFREDVNEHIKTFNYTECREGMATKPNLETKPNLAVQREQRHQ